MSEMDRDKRNHVKHQFLHIVFWLLAHFLPSFATMLFLFDMRLISED